MITPGEWVKSRRSNPSGCCVEVALVRKGEEAEAVWTVLLAPGTVKDVHNERPAPRAAGKDSGWLIGVRDSHDRDGPRSEEHTSELQSRPHLVCRLLLE